MLTVNGANTLPDLTLVKPEFSAASPFIQSQVNPPSSYHFTATNPAHLAASPAPSTAAASPATAAAVEVSPLLAGVTTTPPSTMSDTPNASEHKSSDPGMRSSRAQSLSERSRGRQTGLLGPDVLPSARRRSGHVRTRSNSSLGSARSGRGTNKDRDGLNRSRVVWLPTSFKVIAVLPRLLDAYSTIVHQLSLTIV
jgi:hypothetical protein